MPEQTKIVSLRMTPYRFARLKAQAATRGMTTTCLITEAIEQYLERNPLSDQEKVAYEIMLLHFREKM